MKAIVLVCSMLACITLMPACFPSSPIEGKWEYDGGVYNGKLKKADPSFKMQRTYTADNYEAYVTDGGAAPVKYGAGKYEIKADTFNVTSTYSSQPSQSLGKTIHYVFKIEGNKLTIKGMLPNGAQVEEYWKKLP